jgi:hypothetical protein
VEQTSLLRLPLSALCVAELVQTNSCRRPDGKDCSSNRRSNQGQSTCLFLWTVRNCAPTQIGREAALRLLRSGATVHLTTRFPVDCVKRFVKKAISSFESSFFLRFTPRSDLRKKPTRRSGCRDCSFTGSICVICELCSALPISNIDNSTIALCHDFVSHRFAREVPVPINLDTTAPCLFSTKNKTGAACADQQRGANGASAAGVLRASDRERDARGDAPIAAKVCRHCNFPSFCCLDSECCCCCFD